MGCLPTPRRPGHLTPTRPLLHCCHTHRNLSLRLFISVCQKCQPYCADCDDASTCLVCQTTPKRYFLSGGQCIIPCTLPTSLGSNVEPNEAGVNDLGCEAGEVLDEGLSCDVKCETGYYVSNGGTTAYTCSATGATLTSATAVCSACVLANCLACSSATICTSCASGYQVG